jgi:hypothetical protein
MTKVSDLSDLCTSPEASVECVLGNVNTQYSVSHFKASSSDPRSNGSASINLVDLGPIASQLKQRSFEKRGRIYRSGLVAKGTPQAQAFLAIRQNDQLPDIRNVQGTTGNGHS